MKVILSIDQIKHPITGVGRYAYELAKELAKLPEMESLRYFRGTGFDSELVCARSSHSPLKRLVRGFAKSGIAVDLYRQIALRLKTRVLRGHEDHLFHGTSFYLPPFHGTSVVTIHDLSAFKWPQYHPPERVRYMGDEVKFALQQAALLITDSEYTRCEISQYFSWPIDKIVSVPLASAACFHPREAAELESCLAKYALPLNSYSLFVGTIEPRKNIGVLLDAYERLPASLRQRRPLVLTGYEGWNNAEIHDRIARAERAGWLRYLGFVDREDLPPIYAGARLFVFPSLYEGFGLPILEAMASGVPVVCSNASSLPEVAGSAALMCEAQDVVQLTQLIQRGLEDDSWRTSASFLGLSKAADFTWARCARQTANAYEKALQN